MAAMRESWTDERLDEFGRRIDERFDRVDERFDELGRMTSQRFENVDRRIEELGRESRRRFDALAEESNRRFDASIEENNRRFDEVERSVAEVNTRLMRVEDAIGGLQRGMAYGAVGLAGAMLAGFAAMTTLLATQV